LKPDVASEAYLLKLREYFSHFSFEPLTNSALLSRAQAALRATAMPEYHNSDGSFKSDMTEASVVQSWMTAFKTAARSQNNIRK